MNMRDTVLKSYKAYLVSKGQSKSTIAGNEKNVLNYITWGDIENIEVEQAEHREILTYIKHLQKRELTQKTIQSYLISLGHYYNWQIELNHRETNPIKNIKLKGIQKNTLYEVLKKQELETLYNHYLTEETEPTLVQKRNKIIIGLLVYQGLGTTELANLQVTDVKLREAKIYIAGTRRSNERTLKLASTQILDLMEYTLQVRQELLELTKKESKQLIISTGTGTRIHNLISTLLKQLKKQNPKVTSINQIRTSVIMYWLKLYNLRETQYKAGHRYISSTENYLINDLDELQEDISKYHPI